MDLIAVEPFDGFKPGDPVTVSDRQGKQLVDKGLAKMAPAPRNKMAPRGENKENPSPAVGEVRRSSASPAAHRSPAKMSSASARGGTSMRDRIRQDADNAKAKRAPRKTATKKVTARTSNRDE